MNARIMTPDTPKQPSQGRLLRLVMIFAVSLVTVSALSLLSVGLIASKEADDQAAATELRLFNNALKDRQGLMARDLLLMARWDDSVKGIAIDFDEDFIRDDFMSTLWWDSGHERTFVVAPGGKVVASSREDRIDFTPRQLADTEDLAIIARRAVDTHMRYRIPIDGGYGQRVVKSTDIGEISVFGFAFVDGGPAIVSAMAIVPDEEEVAMPEGPPHILISAKAIDRELVRDLNTQLAFRDLAFSDDVDGKVKVVSASGRAIGSFSWSGARPGSHIWDIVVPIVLVLSLLLVLAGGFVMRHISRLSSLLAESESRIRHLALHDPLSGLANRLNFDQQLARAAADAKRRPFAAIACDLDRFKAVNDTHGHAAGDTVIRTVADRLRHTVGDQGLVGRIGGDEFVILVTAFSDRHRLMLLATQIMAAVGEPIALDGGAVVDVGVSLGITVSPDCGTLPTEIMAAADRALYASKAGGRGRALFATEVTAASDAESDAA
ncbi:diguanylate cyclase [Ciceribacter sp. L1K23]|uniref:diguanylate cyclase domain-containing protein n=1 Tax=Ciceribacter sp. L1K23 TaxID=2820276 RepID=UPI001B81EEAD|nr:diguanylate cyclase [Ciceribacter sp. L1K23]MBR0555876.1 diguanylate cyclase [Ciceribacter sp. L1K23]